MAMRSIGPRSAYNRNNFVNAMEDLSKLEYLAQTLNSGSGHDWDPELRRDLGNLLRDNQIFYAGLTPDNVKNDSGEAYFDYQNRINEYSKDKLEILLDKVSAIGSLSLVLSLPLVETGNKDYDKIKKIIDRKREIDFAEKQGRIEDYVNNKLKKASDWRKEAYFKYSMGDPSYITRTFNAYKIDNEMDFNRAIRRESGQIYRKKLLDLIKANYNKIVGDEENREDSDKAKLYRSVIAKYAYEALKETNQ